MPNLLPMKDSTDRFKVAKKVVPSLPFRMLVTAKSGGGKSSLLGNILLRDSWYNKDFEGENIYIFSGSLKSDDKLATIIKQKDIPPENLFGGYHNDVGNELYDMLVEDFIEFRKDHPKKTPPHTLIIFDDLSFSGDLKNTGKQSFIERLAANSRKHNISFVILAQKYSQISTGVRENATAAFFGESTTKQEELIANDYAYRMKKAEFIKMMDQATDAPFSFLFINLGLPVKDRYYDTEFKPIHPMLKKV
jgi:hypothetical protein